MWIESDFIENLTDALDSLSKGKDVDSEQLFRKYNSSKYTRMIDKLKDANDKMKTDRDDISVLLKDSNMMNQGARDGKLDVRIDESHYKNNDFKEIANGINGTMESTVVALRDIGDNLDRLSNGDFQAQVTTNYEGDYKILQVATNALGDLLNRLIVDSNKMNQGARDGKLDIRIDEKQYIGDFSKIANGINGTMEATVLALRVVGESIDKLSNGDLTAKITGNYKGDYKILQIATNQLSKILNENKITNDTHSWLQSGVAGLNEELSGDSDILTTATHAIEYLANYLNVGVGAIYSYDHSTKLLNLNGSYAYVQRDELSNSFKLGEGVVGQVALQKSPIQLKNIKREQLIIDTATTSMPPLNTYTFPLIYQDKLYGVIELGSHELFDKKAMELFEMANGIIATAIYSAIQNEKVKVLLHETEIKNEEVQKINTQMEEQQQKIEEANTTMEEQQNLLQEKNDIMAIAQKELDEKNEDLEQSNQYKTDFLANMSHELRTPLNSIILLSEMLKENRTEHLDIDEIKKAAIINSSGNELLRLINDILDLSKVEAGKMELIVDKFSSDNLCEEFQINFEHSADARNLEFITIDEYQKDISNDKDRLSQVIRNLISNALKFTKQGSITLKVEDAPNNQIKISVIDTGIGIPQDKVDSIFEAFQQAQGGTSREYGGTGLGLSISKELAKLMKGKVTLSSEVGKGSVFSIIIPNLDEDTHDLLTTTMETKQSIGKQTSLKPQEEKIVISKVDDDRDKLTQDNKVFLIIEDDKDFATILRDKINESGDLALVALNGEDGLSLAKHYNIKGILLDLGLPDMDGIDLLKEFKTNMRFRKIPVYVISGEEKEKLTKEQGAIGYIHKPVSENDISSAIVKINKFNDKKVKDLLIVEDDKIQQEALIEFIGNGTIKSKGVQSVKDAIEELNAGDYDGVVVDLTLEDGTGYEVCEYIKKNNLNIPTIIYTGKDLTIQEEHKLRKYADSIIIKTAASQKKLLNEIDIFMHRVKKSTKVKNIDLDDISLDNIKVLVVDDDIRNVYVLTEALDAKGMNIITASNGQEAIDILNENTDTDIVLMDIMMPVMDGYETTRSIKTNERTKDIPVIALTAKAMNEDRQIALDAGFDDYTTKPIKMDILINIIKSWIDKK